MEDSKARLAKLAAGRKGASASTADTLAHMRSVKLANIALKKGQAEFSLVFDGSAKPERAEFQEGDSELVSAEQALIDANYPVTFPDYSSVKIVRTASVTCSAGGCTAVLKPMESARINAMLESLVSAR